MCHCLSSLARWEEHLRRTENLLNKTEFASPKTALKTREVARQRMRSDVGSRRLAAEELDEGRGSRDCERRELNTAFSTTQVPPGSGGLSESSGASSSLGRLAREPLTSRTRSDIADAKVALGSRRVVELGVGLGLWSGERGMEEDLDDGNEEEPLKVVQPNSSDLLGTLPDSESKA